VVQPLRIHSTSLTFLYSKLIYLSRRRFLGQKGGIAVAIRKDTPHNHVDLPPLDSVEATGVCIPIGNSEILPAALYKSPGLPGLMRTLLSS
jgi:hypothetical protein